MTVSGAARLREIKVDGLFGDRDFQIAMDDERRPTVLTGANGTGKSTILRILQAVSRGDVEALGTAPLSRLELRFDGTHTFVLDRNGTEVSVKWGKRSGKFDLQRSRAIEELPVWARDIFYGPIDPSEIRLELLRRQPRGDLPYQELSELTESVRAILDMDAPVAPPWFESLSARFRVLFISDQRLIEEPKRTWLKAGVGAAAAARRARGLGSMHAHRESWQGQRAIESASVDIARRIQQADSDYARISQQQDRVFPNMLIEAMKSSGDVSLTKIDGLINQVESKRETLRQAGLLDRIVGHEPQVESEDLHDENIRSVMAAVMEMSLRKFDVLDSLAERLTKYKEFLDRRYQPKSISLHRDDGIRVNIPGNGALSPRQLSSGEQQMAVLAYEILFRTGENTLVIVDEPEISLHVLWQHSLIDDLTEMSSAAGLQFLMATHSPVILANHSDLERSLDPVNQ